VRELEASAAEDASAVVAKGRASVLEFIRNKLVRAPLPAHLLREGMAIADPTAIVTGSLMPRLMQAIRINPISHARRSPPDGYSVLRHGRLSKLL
jgi:hypothetical protein